MRTLILCLLLTACSPGSQFTIKDSNDYFSPRTNKDVNYTQGLRMGVEVPDDTGSHSYYAQQLFYTPTDKKSVVPSPDSRRYAGYLAGGYEKKVYDGTRIGLELGIVGPHAYGKETQRAFHSWIGQGFPAGWDSQISDRPTVLTTFEYRPLVFRKQYVDFYYFVGANAGNIFNQAYSGITLRVGTGLEDEILPIFPRAGERDYFRGHLFITLMQRAVAYNLFLAGKELPYVAEGRVGVHFDIGDYFLQYMLIKQSREYESEKYGMTFGEVALGVKW
jgi:hypothetical protein